MKINWTKEHTKGLIIGLITTFLVSFLVVGMLAWKNGYSYNVSLQGFFHKKAHAAKVISLASIANLLWFHFGSIKKENWALGMGIIAATFISLLLFLYLKFIA